MRETMLVLMLAGCAGKTEETAEPAPTITWLLPREGSSVTAGDLSCSLIVEGIDLQSPALRPAALHNSGAPIGYLELSLDGVVVLETGETTPTIPVEAGEHTLTAALLYIDGDEVLVNGDALCEEEAEGCEPVVSEVGFSAE